MSADFSPVHPSTARQAARPLRIGIDGRALAGPLAGSGRYLGELCKALHELLPEAQFIVFSPTPAPPPVTDPRWRVVCATGQAAHRLPGIVWSMACVGRLAAREALDIFWGPSNFLPLFLPRRCFAVLTVLDLVHRIMPDSMHLNNRLAFLLFFRQALRRADHVISISEGTAQRLKDWGYRPAHSVIRPAAAAVFAPPAPAAMAAARQQLNLPARYLVSVATLEPRKNLTTLIDAFAAARAAGELANTTLLLAGQSGWKNARLQAEIAARHGEGLPIRLLGHVPDALLPALYAGASAVVLPSIYEGFGLPALEARLCGARVVATDIPEIHEAGGAQAIYVAPTCDGLRQGIRQALASGGPASGDDTPPPSWAAGAKRLAQIFRQGAERGRT